MIHQNFRFQIIWEFQSGICLTNSQFKKIHGNLGVFLDLFFSKKKFNNIIKSKISIPFAKLCTPFVFNWIWIQFNVLHLSLKFQFNSSCKQCHSILSFECKLIFTKAIHFFSLVDHGTQVFKYVDWRS